MSEKKAMAYNLDIQCIEWAANQAKKLDTSASKIVNQLIKEAMNGKKPQKSAARPRR